MRLRFLTVLLACGLFALPAYAYVGPGLGLGAIGVVLGLLFSLVLALFAFVWMPIKRLFRRKKPTVDEMPGDDA